MNNYNNNSNYNNYGGNMNYPTAPDNNNYNYGNNNQNNSNRNPNGGKFDSVLTPFENIPSTENQGNSNNLDLNSKDIDVEEAQETGIRNIGNSCYM